MSVLIKGLHTPKSCDGCFFDILGSCLINSNIEPKNKLTHSCPLIDLPDHGDLIDRDALKRLVDEEWFDCQEKSAFFDEIDKTPTVCTGCGWAAVATQDECDECKRMRKEERNEPQKRHGDALEERHLV